MYAHTFESRRPEASALRGMGIGLGFRGMGIHIIPLPFGPAALEGMGMPLPFEHAPCMVWYVCGPQGYGHTYHTSALRACGPPLPFGPAALEGMGMPLPFEHAPCMVWYVCGPLYGMVCMQVRRVEVWAYHTEGQRYGHTMPALRACIMHGAFGLCLICMPDCPRAAGPKGRGMICMGAGPGMVWAYLRACPWAYLRGHASGHTSASAEVWA